MDFDVYDASAWILRSGVVASVATMLVGLAESFREGIVSVELMQSERFQADLGAILRVATALALFARERDRLYTAIAAFVLAVSLGSLMLAR